MNLNILLKVNVPVTGHERVSGYLHKNLLLLILNAFLIINCNFLIFKIIYN